MIPGSGRSPGEGIGYPLQYCCASLVVQLVKNPPAMWESWLSTPVFWPREFHGLYAPWGHKELDTTEQHSLPLSRGFPNPGMELRSPALQVDSLPGESQGKPKNTGVGSLFLLQQIFLAQGVNPHFLHCRQILYWLSQHVFFYLQIHLINFSLLIRHCKKVTTKNITNNTIEQL